MGRKPGNEDIPLGNVFFNLCRGKNKQEIGDNLGFHRQSISRRITRLNKELTPEQLKKLILKEISELDTSKLE